MARILGFLLKRTYSTPLVCFAFLILSSVGVYAASSGITYHGRLLKPDGTAVAANTQFKIQIRTPGSENCLMYEETQSKDLSTTNGMFSITINDGTGTRTDSAAYTMNQIFANRSTFSFSISDCTAVNTYTPGVAEGRVLKVFFNDGSFAGWEPMPPQAINFVPMAIESYSTGGFTAKSLLRVEDGATLGNVSSLTTANFNELMALILGTSSQYTKAGQLNGSALPAMTNGQTLGWNGSAWSAVTPLTSESDPTVKAFAKSNLPTCSAGEVLKADGTSFSCVTDAGGWTASDATTSAKGIVQISATGGIDVNAGVIQLSDVGTSGDYYKVHTDAKGRVVSGSASLAETDIPTLTTAGKVSGNAITSGTIGGSTAISTSGNVTAGTGSFSALTSGQLSLYDHATTNTNYVTIKTPATASLTSDYTLTLPPTLASVNGQVLTSDTSGVLSWTTVSAGGGGTVNSVTSGGAPITVGGTTADPTISVNTASTSAKGVVQLATSSDTTAGLVVQADDSRLTNGRAPTGSASGDLSGTYPGPTVSGISGKPVLYTSIASGQYLKYDGTNIVNANIAISDVTNLSTQLSNKLDAANMPANCAAGSTLTFSSPTGTWACTAIVVGASNFGSQTANTFLAAPNGSAGTPTFRTIAAADLPASASYWQAATGGIHYSSGNVGIGTTTPASALDVRGAITSTGGQGAEFFGFNSSATNGSLALGDNASATNGSVAIGKSTTAATGGVSVGPSASATSGGVAVGSGASSTSNGLALGAGKTAINNGISIGSSASNTDGELDISWGSGRIHGSNTGNVGIGTATPQAILDVYKVDTNSSHVSTIGAQAVAVATVAGFTTGLSTTATAPAGGTGLAVAATGTAAGSTSTGALVSNVTSDGDALGFKLGSVNSMSGTGYGVGLFNVSGGTEARGLSVASVTSTSGKGYGVGLFSVSGGTEARGLSVASVTSTSGTAYGLYLGNVSGSTASYSIFSANAQPIYFNGKVGIGTTTPRAKMDVSGPIVAAPAVSNSTTTIDFSTGNTQYTSQACQAFALRNLKDGGQFSFYIQNTTSATCSFTAYSDAGVTALTVRMPLNHAATYVGYHTVYQFSVVGTTVYVTWMTGL